MIGFYIITYLLIGYSISFYITWKMGLFDSGLNLWLTLIANALIWPVQVIAFMFGLVVGIVNSIRRK